MDALTQLNAIHLRSDLIVNMYIIGVGRFRILGGGARFRILGGQGGGKFPNRHMTSY